MIEGEVDQLQKAIEGLHRCSARLVRSVPVKETHEGATVWEGVVHVFALEGHPKATRVYAWSSPIEGTPDGRRFFAVLHEPPVTSPSAAVRAAIEAGHKAADDHEQRWVGWHPGEPKD
jgi:hypothetical protein